MALEAKRTLVKSAPELWAEISDVAALARHLGELGEIRITRAQPEELVEWEGDRATGTVRLEPSGWGTRVTLTAEPTPPPEEPPASAADATAAPEPAAITPEPATPEPAEPATPAASDPDPAGEPATPAAFTPEPSDPAAITPEPAPTPRPGFFARLFRRFRRSAPPAPFAAAPGASVTDEPAEPHAALAEPDTPRAVTTEQAEPHEAPPEPDMPPTVTTEQAEPHAAPAEPDAPPTIAAQPDEPHTDAPVAGAPTAGPDDDIVLAILTGTLDRLGSAHHRPFSRG